MKPAVRQFYRTAILAFEHAYGHSLAKDHADAVQVVLSLDFGIEMLLKAVLLDRGESIMNGKNSITLFDALRQCGTYKQASTVEVLRERRNNLQHFAQYTDLATTRDLYEGALLFVAEVLDAEFKLKVPKSVRMFPLRIPTISGIEQLTSASELQRDVDASNDVVVWAQGVPGTSMLAVHAQLGAGEVKKLTPDGEFEYMPKTNGTLVVAYRQSGGVVLYDLATGKRTIIAEAGGPTDISSDWVAAQGLSIQGGLGGGIWLYSLVGESWEQLSEAGDSARLTDDHIVWAELEGEEVVVKVRALVDGATSRTLLASASQPSASGERIAWVDWRSSRPRVHVSTFEGSEIYSASGGFFPHLRGDVLAYLVADGDSHSLVVDDVVRGENILSVPKVGFPIGSALAITEDAIYFESKSNREVHAIFRQGFSY
ncbi:hypothetical protein [Lentzea aerocolonigenes]|uniref:hypothetical protein n=1 Tax=Lentzea aerocolonigenes TaxID=68170 RepID=UPI000A944567|nr:hypothetical protein [Lentzea aerocolonigenes]MCP2242888.1 hypothetical protein [Lentzea aerocolonigenes]